MKKMAAGALLMWAACLYGLQAHATPLPQELRAALPSAALSGQATMTFWGLKVYRARLWVTPAFVAAAYEQSAFALELAYLRDFKGADIASRSLTEMRRQLQERLALSVSELDSLVGQLRSQLDVSLARALE